MTRFRLVTIAAGAISALAFATPADVRAQTLDTFGVLGGSTVTNTGTSVITGNVGVWPGPDVVGFPPGIVVSGTIHETDAVANNAQAELTTAYNNFAAMVATLNLTGLDLGGRVLGAGVYRFANSAQLTGQLTLDGGGDPNALFVFNIESTLTTASGSSIVLTNGARAANVFFRVGSSATLGTTTVFRGKILALTSISLDNAASITCGAAWARNGAVTLINNVITICAFASELTLSATGNQIAIANALDAFITGGGILPAAFQDLLDLLGTLTPEEQAAAFAQLSGEIGSGAAPAGAQSMNSFLSLLTPFLDEDERGLDEDTVRALGYAGDDAQPSGAASAVASFDSKSVRVTGPRGWNIWAGVYGSHNTTAGDAATGSHERSTSAFGFAGGFDTDVSAATRFGVAFSGGGSNFGLSQDLGTGRSDVLQAAIYSRTNFDTAHFNNAYVATTLAYGWNGVTTDRFVIIAAAEPPVSEHFRSSYSAHNVAGEIEAGYRYNEWLSPYAALRVQAFFAPAYSETAATGSTSVFALNYHANTMTSIRTELGARFNHSIALHDGATLALRGRAAWAHDFGTGPNVVAEFQAIPGAPFTVQGAAAGHDSLLLTAGAEVGFTNGFAVAGTFDSELALGSQTYAGTGRVSYRW